MNSPGSTQQADIGIRFEPNPKLHEMSYVFYRSDLLILDEYGVDIVINDSVNWTDESRGGTHRLYPIFIFDDWIDRLPNYATITTWGVF